MYPFGMSLDKRIQKIRALLPRTMLRDREILSRRLERISREPRKREPEKLATLLAPVERQAVASAEERRHRLDRRPSVTYPENLPITSKREQIVRLIKENQVVIVSGETGCGKSTQIPKMCLDAGRGIAGKIGCTQPRRIAAITIAHRIAEELGEGIGRSVGYKIRFREKSSTQAFIKIMTDGMLLAETQGDPELHEYDTLIIDEAHERSLNIDFILGILRTLLPRRPELKVIITSATLDTEKFSLAFDYAPVVNVEGRTYPVEVEYLPIDPELEETGEITYVDMAVKAIDGLREERRYGDVLVFMPTEDDILETCERLEGRRYPGTTILPLFARLPASEQGRVYSVTGSKIVVATNVAETSLTIPGIRYVIDTGLARISKYLPRTRTTSLPISPISQSSADQRKGRCGRVQHGVCIRLYSEEEYDSRPPFTLPEIQRANLAEVILRMLFLNLGHPSDFPFLDPPGERSVKDGFDLLTELGSVRREGERFALTGKGKLMARMPLDPRISRMIIEASHEGCLGEVAVIAAALSIQDPRERPAEKASQADQAHTPFKDPDSDFLTLVNIWNRFHREWETLKTQNRMRKFCKQNFLSYPRMREWVYTHEQITGILKEQKIALQETAGDFRYARIHRSVLSGFLSNIAVKKEKNMYQAARGRQVMIFPGSTLFNKSPAWIVSAEMVKTSRLFARTVGRIEPDWIEPLGGDLCRSTTFEPHWERSRGEVRAFEQVSLYGLVIVPRRPLSYGPIALEEAHQIFVQQALVEGDVAEPLSFLTHNQELIRKLKTLEAKLRRRDLVASDSALAEFYSSRLPGVYDIRTLKKAIREKRGDAFLRLKESNLLLSHPDEKELAEYPDHMVTGGRTYEFTYAFAPGREEDGVSLKVPSGQVSRVPLESLDWGVPGLLKEKVTALIKGLPKTYRKQLVPVAQTVEVILREMEKGEPSLVNALARFVYRKFGVDIPASVWAAVGIPEYLKMRLSVVDHAGKPLESGRDIHLLIESDAKRHGTESSSAWKKAQEKWERQGITTWDFEALPESISLTERLLAYPALTPEEDLASLRLFRTQEQAHASHEKGVQHLLTLHSAKDLKHVRRSLTLPSEAYAGARYFGGMRPVEELLYQALLRHLFRKNLRTRQEFLSYAESCKTLMMAKATELKDVAVRILEAYDRLRSILHTIEKANTSREAVLALCRQIRVELDALVPRNFPDLYSLDELTHLPRYLKAFEVRAERGAHDPEKDKSKQAQTEEFGEALRSMKESLNPATSEEKRAAVESFRWMLEEFRVSLFAQELKTRFPVSRKKLEDARKEIERML
jgi:ATP-dependent helicase HrpA